MGGVDARRAYTNQDLLPAGSTALTNTLAKKLPAAYIAQLPGGVAGAYSAIPSIASLPQPLQAEVRTVFAESIRVIWLVLIPFGGIGLICALGMKAMKLETVTDEVCAGNFFHALLRMLIVYCKFCSRGV